MKANKTTGTNHPASIQLRREMQQELDLLLSWWMSNMIDQDNGGFYGRRDGFGDLHAQADKGVILNTRTLWTFAAAARLTQNTAYQQTADRAYQYLLDHFFDRKKGGVYWMLTYQGKPLAAKKQIYAQAFAIYALTEYYLLKNNADALNRALEIYWLIEKYSSDPLRGGYYEAFSQDWQPLEDQRLSEKDANTAKTMNTHLHLLEAYTNLYRVHPIAAVSQSLKNLIECFLEKFISRQTHHLRLFFDEKWRSQSSIISYGHDIECSWLLPEAAEVLGDRDLIKATAGTAEKMAFATLKEAVDDDGALFNETHEKGHLDSDKHWWPQAEAVIGFWNAWQISREEAYRTAAIRAWEFIKTYLRDKNAGEWHWRVNRAGAPVLSEDKAGPWKAPYHNGRMCMEIIRRMKNL